MSSSHYSNGYYATQPIAMPHKQQQSPYYPYPQMPGSRLSTSPPEASDSGISSGPSYDPSATASSYAASASDYEGTNSTSSIDLLEFMHDRLQSSYDPIQMDRSLVQQAQTSGKLNAKTRQLLELQALAQQRMAAMQAQFSQGLSDAREVQRDLEWSQKKINSLNKRAARKYPKEYSTAQGRYPTSMDS